MIRIGLNIKEKKTFLFVISFDRRDDFLKLTSFTSRMYLAFSVMLQHSIFLYKPDFIADKRIMTYYKVNGLTINSS